MKGLAVIASLALLAGTAGAQSLPRYTPPGGPSFENLPPKSATPGSTSIVLASGQTIIFEVHPDKTLKVLKTEPITPERIRKFRPGRDLTSSAEEGQVAITLLYDPRIGSLLKVENSADFSFDYSAIVSGMSKDGDAYKAPVEVCPSVKGAAFYEIWDHPIAQVFLSDFGRHDTPPPCPGPAKKKPDAVKGTDA